MLEKILFFLFIFGIIVSFFELISIICKLFFKINIKQHHNYGKIIIVIYILIITILYIVSCEKTKVSYNYAIVNYNDTTIEGYLGECNEITYTNLIYNPITKTFIPSTIHTGTYNIRFVDGRKIKVNKDDMLLVNRNIETEDGQE